MKCCQPAKDTSKSPLSLHKKNAQNCNHNHIIIEAASVQKPKERTLKNYHYSLSSPLNLALITSVVVSHRLLPTPGRRSLPIDPSHGPSYPNHIVIDVIQCIYSVRLGLRQPVPDGQFRRRRGLRTVGRGTAAATVLFLVVTDGPDPFGGVIVTRLEVVGHVSGVVVVVLDVVMVVGLEFWPGRGREGPVEGVGFVGEVVLVEPKRCQGLGGRVLLVGDLVVVVVCGRGGGVVVVVRRDWRGVVGEEFHSGLSQVVLVELEECGGCDGGSVTVGRSPPGRWRGSL